MAEAIPFPEANGEYQPPAGSRRLTVPVHVTECGIVVSKWRLSKAEIEEVSRTGTVWLLASGGVHPPIIVEVEYPFQPQGAAS